MKKYLFLFLFVFLAACGGQEPATAELTRIRLPMGYIADPQYAPFYVAIEKGYFAEAGFEIEFDYSFETDGVALVGAGQLPFALVSGDVLLLARAQNVPVVYVMEWWQKYPIGVASKASAEIRTPADMVGRVVGIPGLFGATYVAYEGLLAANGLTSDQITLEEVGFNQVEVLLTDRVEAVMVYVNNEPIQLAALGEDINLINVSDYVDMVASGIITNEQYAAENPAQVRAFVAAFTRGLQDTLANPQEAYEISKKYVEGLDDSRLAVLEASLPLWEASQLGYTDADSWAQTQTVLLNMGQMDAPLADLSAAYSNDFLPSP
jgi:NitT/TauT family transport system substrate-binding protein